MSRAGIDDAGSDEATLRTLIAALDQRHTDDYGNWACVEESRWS
jgi:hypothetical protein